MLRVYLDLGDVFAKAVADGPTPRPRVRFPSVVATRLLAPVQIARTHSSHASSSAPAGDGDELLIDTREPFLRAPEFDPRAHPRTRSFERAEAFLAMAATRTTPAGARFAGRLAAVYGADRQWLGANPSDANVDALVHKALILVCAEPSCDAEIVFVVGTGPAGAAVSRYARTLPRTIELALRSYERPEPRRLRVALRGRILDASESAIPALPAEIRPARGRTLALVDIGHFRTKLALFSREGCELQDQLDLGMADCVRRVLRDGSSEGLVEDEYAVVRALERARDGVISIGRRRFDVRKPLDGARRALEEELARGIRRVVLEHYGRRGERCDSLAIVGGGAATVGSALAVRLRGSDIGLRTAWVTPAPNFLLVDGARAIARPSTTG